MNIVVLAGGLSTERDVSFKSGDMVCKALRSLGHKVLLLDVFLGYHDTEEDISDIFEHTEEASVEVSDIPDTAPDIAAVKAAAEGSNIHVGAENVHWAASGAYTGELSAEMLVAAGVEYVIIGHSERRQYFGETDQTVNKRVLAAVAAGLKVILSVGEMKDVREAGATDGLVDYQTIMALNGLTAEQVADVVIAYEPVWAIGTGLTATDEQANETIGVIRKAVARKYGQECADKVRIQYGGSMNPKNVKGLMAQHEIDGGLIGGASLKAEDFSKVVHFDA